MIRRCHYLYYFDKTLFLSTLFHFSSPWVWWLFVMMPTLFLSLLIICITPFFIFFVLRPRRPLLRFVSWLLRRYGRWLPPTFSAAITPMKMYCRGSWWNMCRCWHFECIILRLMPFYEGWFSRSRLSISFSRPPSAFDVVRAVDVVAADDFSAGALRLRVISSLISSSM